MKAPTGTFLLEPLIKDLLRGDHYVAVSEDTAFVIQTVTDSKQFCHLQFPTDNDVDILGRPIESPILWEIGAWSTSSEKWQRQKLLSQRRIDEYNIFNANVHRIARAILKIAYVNPDAARVLAHGMLMRHEEERIKSMGVNKLIETVEEL